MRFLIIANPLRHLSKQFSLNEHFYFVAFCAKVLKSAFHIYVSDCYRLISRLSIIRRESKVEY